MIVVPVMINGAGPFDFQLDTGCMLSIVDKELAEQLRLPLTGRAILASARGEAVTNVAHVDSARMGDASVAGFDVLVVDHFVELPYKVRGTIGEDFLSHFDVYIDNRHHVIQLETAPGPLEEMLSGERLPLSGDGSGGKRLDSNRLVIVGRLDELGKRDSKLQLDSGTPYLLLCSQVSRSDFTNQPVTFPVTGVLKGSFAAYAQTARLRLGKRFFSDVTTVVPTETISLENVDGLLPTSVFQSIFISHSGRFVILNPSTKHPSAKSTLAESNPPHLPKAEISSARVE